MQPFEYLDGDSPAAVIDLHAPRASAYLAGGTTLIDLMKLHVMTPGRVVDLSRLPLRKITDRGQNVEVDALVTNSEMAHDPLIKNNFPFISEALLSGASVQIRNLATTSGNLLQRTRCSYFRDPTARCNKRTPGSGCDALEGFNRMHAIVGGSDQCIASHPSDLCVALMAVDATITVLGPSGKRETPIDRFYALPGSTPQVENVLAPGELILSVSLPKLDWFKRSTYVKIRDRSSYAFALASAAVAIELAGKTVKQVRIAMGGIGTIPWRARAAEARLQGQVLTPEIMQAAARTVTDGAQTSPYNAFKIPLAQQTLIRALQESERRS